jgi:DNA polymerase I-like protein with 3'-5' exonuclease and polymerase domains
LKKAIVPPDGYMVINSDSSQIEARVIAQERYQST